MTSDAHLESRDGFKHQPSLTHLGKLSLALRGVGEPPRHHVADVGLFGGLGAQVGGSG